MHGREWYHWRQMGFGFFCQKLDRNYTVPVSPRKKLHSWGPGASDKWVPATISISKPFPPANARSLPSGGLSVAHFWRDSTAFGTPDAQESGSGSPTGGMS
jgi:hypothetical protein